MIDNKAEYFRKRTVEILGEIMDLEILREKEQMKG